LPCRILSQNNLTTIPDVYFSDLTSLVELWLHFNSISVVTPSTFQNMPTLQGL
jgi:Leucine-rich repeat (LRR) protein